MRTPSTLDEAERARLARLPSELLGPEDIRRLYGVDFSGRLDREGAKNAVINSDISLERIGEALGISSRTITFWMRQEGWVRLYPTRRLPAGRRRQGIGAKKRRAPTKAELRRRNMVQRLYAALDAKLKVLEARMMQAEGPGAVPPSAADTERDLRGLAALTRMFAKLDELEAQAAADAQLNKDSTGGGDDDAEQLRRDLALRLERLAQARNA